MTTPMICVNLNRLQKGFNFKEFKDSGGLGVILKATEGAVIQDQCYKQFRQEASDAGLAIASCHFFKPSDPVTQANYYYNFVQPQKGERVICVFEDENATINNMMIFFQRLQSIGDDLQLTVHSGRTIKEKLGTSSNQWLADNTSLWLAQYNDKPEWPTQVWPHWSLWRYLYQIKVPGFREAVDTNRFCGTEAGFLKWMGVQKIRPTAPTVSITFASNSPVTISITAGDNVTILHSKV